MLRQRRRCGVCWQLTRPNLGRNVSVISTSDQVAAELLAGQYERNYDEVMCQPYAAGVRHADSLCAIELLGREVLPRLHTPASSAR
jgi:hypothetical protein